MNDKTLDSPAAIKSFLASTCNHTLSVPKPERYTFIAKTLTRTGYFKLSKPDKSAIRAYLLLLTGYSRAQITRLCKAYKKDGSLGKKPVVRHRFPRKYTRDDIVLLAKTDEAHDTLSGPATKKLFERAYHVYGHEKYQRLASISNGHLYNLRKHTTYQNNRRHFTKTTRSPVNLGERRKPQPKGRPGYLRVDTVHQGDQDKQKGVYHINAVDEVTQFEVVLSVERISENHLIPILAMMIEMFPFVIKGFHSDCGSEYINRHVVRLLNKLNIELTKSRARHCNDNGLAESKNAAIVRKCFGYIHIQQKWAATLNAFNKDYLFPYINFHRPCYFAQVITDNKGKEKKKYPYHKINTPYEKLKSLDNATQYLKPETSFEILEKQAMVMTDLEAVTALNTARKHLFATIFPKE